MSNAPPRPPGVRTAARTVEPTGAYGHGDAAVRALDGRLARVSGGAVHDHHGAVGFGQVTLMHGMAGMHCMAGLDTAASGEAYIGETRLTGLPRRGAHPPAGQLRRLRC